MEAYFFTFIFSYICHKWIYSQCRNSNQELYETATGKICKFSFIYLSIYLSSIILLSIAMQPDAAHRMSWRSFHVYTSTLPHSFLIIGKHFNVCMFYYFLTIPLLKDVTTISKVLLLQIIQMFFCIHLFLIGS